MQASALLLHWGSYRWARDLLVLFFFPVMLPSVLPRLTIVSVSWCLETSLFLRLPSWDRIPFPERSSLPTSFVSFFVFYIFRSCFWRQWFAFLGAWCPLLAFRSCFVEFTQRWNVLLMNLWGRKWSPCPIPPPSSEFPLYFLYYRCPGYFHCPNSTSIL